MRTLVYKRTHKGDPDVEGCFGIRDCMGKVRSWGFDAVIGVGGIGAEPRSHGIAGKVNWIGIGPRKTKGADSEWPLVTFDHYVFYGADGPNFLELAPRLAGRMYKKNVRVVIDDLDRVEKAEVEKILDRARGARPSPGNGGRSPEPPRGPCRPSPRPRSVKGC